MPVSVDGNHRKCVVSMPLPNPRRSSGSLIRVLYGFRLPFSAEANSDKHRDCCA